MSLTLLQKKLLNDFQRDFPLSPTPYADIAATLNLTEEQVLQAFQELNQQAVISRIGAIIPPNQIGVSTLAAMSVPEDELERVAAQVSFFQEDIVHRLSDTQDLWENTLNILTPDCLIQY